MIAAKQTQNYTQNRRKIFRVGFAILLLSVGFAILISPKMVFAANEDVFKAAEEAAKLKLSCANNPDAYPWCKTGETPGGFVATFYRIALGLVGGAALGVLIYGAILWTLSEAVTSKEEAKKWITGAIWGLVLLLGAYLILYTINPDLVNIGQTQSFLDTLIKKVEIAPPKSSAVPGLTTGEIQDIDLSYGSSPNALLTEATARDRLANFGIKIPASVKVDGIRKAALDEILDLGTEIVAPGNVFITSVTGGNHAEGTFSHANGYKFDVAPNSELDRIIRTDTSKFENSGRTRTDPLTSRQQAIFINKKTGAEYVYEPEVIQNGVKTRGAHWDVAVKPKSS